MTIQELRARAADTSAAELAPLTEQVAREAGMDDLAAAAAALAAAPGGVQELYDYGYACVERGASFLAVPALTEALRLAPGTRGILIELVAALEREGRHAEAYALLKESGAGGLRDWPDRYLLAHNALMAGELSAASEAVGLLAAPEDAVWEGAHARIRRTVGRADAVRGSAAPLGGRDLRGWHYVLTGGVLATLSPYGYDAGMNGRYAFLQDSPGACRHGLRRLGLVLHAAGLRPRSVSLLPDRSSRILGLAAAGVLGVPAQEYRPGNADTVVVAYDLNDVDETVLAALRERTPGEVLYERATCWTDPPAVSADMSGLLAQHCIEPWGERLHVDGRLPADARPAEEIAADILAAEEDRDEGDGATPPDPDEALAAFAGLARQGGRWPDGPRERVASSGPVGSGRFA
ncbi:hypothetical protein [Streptomyces sp. NBC_01465]|uniref:hypothetical protein n=1 Tax=Streptomyces sp. NBC_01465 TaxID=2903878 RepID=UPI002E34F2FF|nr:hypothetical protein [Streptomyces sp. NBC_01465]